MIMIRTDTVRTEAALEEGLGLHAGNLCRLFSSGRGCPVLNGAWRREPDGRWRHWVYPAGPPEDLKAWSASPSQQPIIGKAWKIMNDCQNAPWSHQAVDQWFAICDAVAIASIETTKLLKKR